MTLSAATYTTLNTVNKPKKSSNISLLQTQSMVSLLSHSLNLSLGKINDGSMRNLSTNILRRGQIIFRNNGWNNERLSTSITKSSLEADALAEASVTVEALDSSNGYVLEDYGVVGVHHVGILCGNLERSLHFYQNILGLTINEARPHDKLPYRGAWLWVGSEMIHLMELPNPDPLVGRPEHGGRDRHACISIQNVSKLKDILDRAGIPYTLSRSGRPAIFTRDPDANALEFTQVD